MTGRLTWLLVALVAVFVNGETPTSIIIDGNMADWASVRSYYDPSDSPNGDVIDLNVVDCHDTDHELQCDQPAHVYNNNTDILEVKFTHDATHMYAYVRVKGQLGRTSETGPGRYYLIVTIDIDDDPVTGYWVHEGGYYPTSPGYDVNFETEFYGGKINKGTVLNHGMNNDTQKAAARLDQIQGFMRMAPGYYPEYTQWVAWAPGQMTAQDAAQCPDGPHTLPDGTTICFQLDEGPQYSPGLVTVALSADGTTAEMGCPFTAMLVNEHGTPNVQLGQKLTVSVSCETDGYYSVPRDWVSDTVVPIRGYFLAPPPPEAPAPSVSVGAVAGIGVGSAAFGAIVATIVTCLCMRSKSVGRKKDYAELDLQPTRG